jgi:hypothetical protein
MQRMLFVPRHFAAGIGRRCQRGQRGPPSQAWSSSACRRDTRPDRTAGKGETSLELHAHPG